jgi:hypothetical protein
MTSPNQPMATIGLLFLAGILCPTVHATTVKIRTAYPDHEGLPKVLVIVRSVEGQPKEFARELSGHDGSVPPLELEPGVYEAISTYPYGNIPTVVHDFLVGNESAAIEITLTSEGDQKINLNEITWKVKVLDQNGRPAVNALVIGRNAEASTGVSTARTDERGLATISIPVDGALIEVLHGKQSWSEPAYDGGDSVNDCRQRCLTQAKARLQKAAQLLTIQTPR